MKVALPNGNIIHEVDEGNGPVSALDAALRKALEPVYPQLKRLALTDYKVRVISLPEDTAVPVEEAEQLKKSLHTLTGTASAIRVIIETRDSDTSRTYSTVGVGTNIIEASWRALVDAVEFKLWKDDDRWAQQGQFEDVAGIAAAAAASSASAASASEVPQRSMQ